MALMPRVRVPSASSQLARSVGRVAQSAAGPLLARRSLQSAVDGRTVMMTGASSGIGRAAAVEIGRAGGTVLLVARSTPRLEEVAREIKASRGVAEVYGADLAAERSIDERGQIVNVSTLGVQTNPPRFSAYTASKAALDAFTRAFPDSAAARGKLDEGESASALQRAVAQLLRGAYW